MHKHLTYIAAKMSFNDIRSSILNKTVRFIANCEFFPNFDVTGKVKDVKLRENESMIYVKTKSGKLITIGSNMTGLSFDIL